MINTLVNGTDKKKEYEAQKKQYRKDKLSREFLRSLPIILDTLDKLPISKEQCLQAIREMMPDA